MLFFFLTGDNCIGKENDGDNSDNSNVNSYHRLSFSVRLSRIQVLFSSTVVPSFAFKRRSQQNCSQCQLSNTLLNKKVFVTKNTRSSAYIQTYSFSPHPELTSRTSSNSHKQTLLTVTLCTVNPAKTRGRVDLAELTVSDHLPQYPN